MIKYKIVVHDEGHLGLWFGDLQIATAISKALDSNPDDHYYFGGSPLSTVKVDGCVGRHFGALAKVTMPSKLSPPSKKQRT